jgi:hypothetical protein
MMIDIDEKKRIDCKEILRHDFMIADHCEFEGHIYGNFNNSHLKMYKKKKVPIQIFL